MQNSLVTLVGNTINITWSPPSTPNGIILQYIVQRINSSGKSYHHISRNQNHLELPYNNDAAALVFVAAVNQYGQSNFKVAQSNGKNNTNTSEHLPIATCKILYSSLSAITLH